MADSGRPAGEEVRCHELVRYRPITTDGWLDQLLSNAWHPTRMYTILAGKVADHILHSTPQRMWALIIRLGDCPPPTGIDPYAEVSAAVLGVAEDKLTETDLSYWRAFAETLHDVLAPHGAEPLTRRDLLWLIRKPGHGHLPVPDEPVTRRRPWRGGFFELAASIRGHNGGGGFIELQQRNPHTGQDQTSYTATLVVADEPPRQVFNARRARVGFKPTSVATHPDPVLRPRVRGQSSPTNVREITAGLGMQGLSAGACRDENL